MRSETEMVAYALEVEAELLPWIPELLADFEELGSNTTLIVEGLQGLHLTPSARVFDLGCGKGAVSLAIARTVGCRVEGIELFEPFVQTCVERAAAAGLSDLCRFHHGDVLKLASRVEPADAAVLAALGDVLGPPETTVAVVRQFVRPGGHMLLYDGYVKDGGARGAPGFEAATSRAEALQRLQTHGDLLTREIIDQSDLPAAYAREVAQIQRRAKALAERHPDLKAELIRYADDQRRAYAYMEENYVPALFVLQRGA